MSKTDSSNKAAALLRFVLSCTKMLTQYKNAQALIFLQVYTDDRIDNPLFLPGYMHLLLPWLP